MSSRSPDIVDPWRLANLGKALSGAVALQKLPRLAGLLLNKDGEASYLLTFYRDDKKRVRINGHVRAELVLQCQRCLENMRLPVDCELDLAVIEVPEEADGLPYECEPVMAQEDSLRPLDLVEEELLLAIPQIPMHRPEECQSDIDGYSSGPEGFVDQEEAAEEQNPFAVLAGLKDHKEN